MTSVNLEDLQLKATSFVRRLDAIAKDLEITLVSLEKGKMVFIDNASGLQVNVDLVADREARKASADSVQGRHHVGTPTIKIH